MAASSSSSLIDTVSSPLQGFQTLVSNLHVDVTLDDVMVSSAVNMLFAGHKSCISNRQHSFVISLCRICSVPEPGPCHRLIHDVLMYFLSG